MAKQEWQQQGLCTKLSAEEADKLFFIGPGQSSKRAMLFCKNCPVRRECSQFAITYSEYGIWAGNTEDDRSTLDSFIKDGLRAIAETKGILESRNINDFIPLPQVQIIVDLLLKQEPQEELVVALDPQFDSSNDPREYAV